MNFSKIFGLRSVCAMMIVAAFSIGKAQAFEMGVIGGLQTTDVETNASGASTSSEVGFRIGVLGFAEISPQSYIRTGAILGQRKFEISQATGLGTLNAEFEFLYLEVPVTFLYLFNENVGIYGGLEAGLRLSDSCKVPGFTCDVLDPESLIYGPTFGGHFRFTPNLGMEVGYFLGVSKVNGRGNGKVENPSGLQVSAMFIF